MGAPTPARLPTTRGAGPPPRVQLAAQQAGCKGSAGILHANIAWAFALLGQADQVVDALGRARGELEHVAPDDAPEWARFAITDADIHAMAGPVYLTLVQHPEHVRFVDKAAGHAREAVSLRDPEYGRSHVFDLLLYAAANARSGEYGEAASYGSRALDRLDDGGIQSVRARHRLGEFLELVAPHADQHPGIAALQARFEKLRPG